MCLLSVVSSNTVDLLSLIHGFLLTQHSHNYAPFSLLQGDIHHEVSLLGLRHFITAHYHKENVQLWATTTELS